jgi:hypothetical protein
LLCLGIGFQNNGLFGMLCSSATLLPFGMMCSSATLLCVGIGFHNNGLFVMLCSRATLLLFGMLCDSATLLCVLLFGMLCSSATLLGSICQKHPRHFRWPHSAKESICPILSEWCWLCGVFSGTAASWHLNSGAVWIQAKVLWLPPSGMLCSSAALLGSIGDGLFGMLCSSATLLGSIVVFAWHIAVL